MRHTSWRWLAGLLIGLAGTGVPGAAAAQDAALPLRVVSTSPNGPTTTGVTQAAIRFSEPMVAVADAEADAVPYVHVTPDVPVTFHWSDTNALVVTPVKERFPYASTITVRIDAEATALSGHRLAAPVSFTFETPAPRLVSAYASLGQDEMRHVELVFDQDVDVATAAGRVAVTIETDEALLPKLSAPARRYLTQVDPKALAAHDTWLRRLREVLAAAQSLPYAVERSANTSSSLTVVFPRPVPFGGRVVVRADGVASPEGPLRRRTVDQQITSARAPFAFVERDCVGTCEPSAVSVRPNRQVDQDALRAAFRVLDITQAARPRPITPLPLVSRPPFRQEEGLRGLGFTLTPGHRYAIRVDSGLMAASGERLDTPWCTVVEVGLPGSFVTFGAQGPAVWEAGLGPKLPILTQSVVDVRGGAVAMAPSAIVPALMAGAGGNRWTGAPAVPRTITRVPGPIDGSVREAQVSVKPALSPAGTGVVWASFPGGLEAPGVSSVVTVRPVRHLGATIVQVTNIGITVRGSARGLALLASRLDTAAPVPDASVTLLDRGNSTLWRGRTDANGLVQVRVEDWIMRGDGTPCAAVVEREGDTAFVLIPSSYAPRSRQQATVGVLFTDRGLYRPGESMRVRAFVQESGPEGLRPIAAGTSVKLTFDHDGDTVAVYEGALDAVGGVEWTVPIAVDAKPDDPYTLRLQRATADGTGDELECDVLVKAFRPAEFAVAVTAAAVMTPEAPRIDASVDAHDLSEVPLAGAPVAWTITRETQRQLPAVLERDPEFAYAPFNREVEEAYWSGLVPALTIAVEGSIDGAGRHAIQPRLPDGFLGRGAFTVAAQVRDTSSQVIGSTTLVEVPADVYLGLRADSSTLTKESAVWLVARTPGGDPVAGIAVDVSVERPDGGPLVLHVTTTTEPLRLVVPSFTSTPRAIVATARGARQVVMPVVLLAYEAPAPETPASPSLQLTLDRERYEPGATARLTVTSPWREATAMVTLERGAILRAEIARVVDGVATVALPVGPSPTSGLVAAVTLVRGRTAPCCAGPDDDGRPASITADIPVPIDAAAAKLVVAIEGPATFAAPGRTTRIRLRVHDAAHQPAPGRVTLWAVDEGVLALSGYQPPDPGRMYAIESVPLVSADTRSLLLGHLVPEPPWNGLQTSSSARSYQSMQKAGEPGDGESAVRRDLRPLAFWYGAIDTKADGTAEVEAALPDTLTTYRVMAIAADTAGRYGTASAPLVVAKRLMARPAVPRVLTRDDRPSLRATIASRDLSGSGTVVIESLTPDLLTIDTKAAQPIAVSPEARAVIAVAALARAPGVARIRVTASVGDAHDVIERDIPILEATIRETSAAFGEVQARPAIEAIRLPEAVDPTAGGLDLEVASSLLVGLAASGEYVRDYQYLCAEQVASRALVLTLAPDLGPGFAASLGLGDEAARRAQTQAVLDTLLGYRCQGRFSYWKGSCRLTSLALDAYVLHVLDTAVRHGFTVDAGARDAVADALTEALARPIPARPTFTDSAAIRAFAVKVLADAGRRPVKAVDAVYARRDGLSVTATAHLLDAVHTLDPASPRLAELRRQIRNAITPAGATAHVEERWLPEYAWLWPSQDKATGVVLDALTRTGSITLEEARPLVAGLMAQRRQGIWIGTQGNVWALSGLASYRRAFEVSGAPITATATLASTRLLRETLSAERPAHVRQVPMPELRAIATPGRQTRLAIESSGPGPLFYATRLAWRRSARGADPLAHGITLSRRYERLVNGTPQAAGTTFAAGDVVRVTVLVRVPEARTFVAVTDPLPAGFEAIDTTLAGAGQDAADKDPSRWGQWVAGFDHLQRYDDRVDLFATWLGPGTHTVQYLARATTPGTFFAAPTRAEMMYEPEVAGRGAGATITVTPTP